jgi:hypothetical protein
LVGDSAPDFETFVEDADALSDESKLLLDDQRPDLANEGAAESLREGDPLGRLGSAGDGGVPGVVRPEAEDVGDLDLGPDDPRDLLAGVDPGSLMDPLVAGPGSDAATELAKDGANAGMMGSDELHDLQKIGDLAASDIKGTDPRSAVERVIVHQTIGSTPDPADQETADAAAEKAAAEKEAAEKEAAAEKAKEEAEKAGAEEDGGSEADDTDGEEAPDAIAGGCGPDVTPDPDDPGSDSLPVDPKRAPPGFLGSSTDPPHLPEDPFQEKSDPFTTLIQPSGEEGATPPPAAVAERLDPSLEAQQAGFTDPAPGDDGGTGGDEPFDVVDTLIDPPEMLEGGALGGLDDPLDPEGAGPVVDDGDSDSGLEELP